MVMQEDMPFAMSTIGHMPLLTITYACVGEYQGMPGWHKGSKGLHVDTQLEMQRHAFQHVVLTVKEPFLFPPLLFPPLPFLPSLPLPQALWW